MDLSFTAMYYSQLYDFFMSSGLYYWYGLSFVLAIIVYFHSGMSGNEPALAWAFLTFAIPIIGLLIYILDFICLYRGVCRKKEDKEYSKKLKTMWEKDEGKMEIENEWEDTGISEKKSVHKSENMEPYRKR